MPLDLISRSYHLLLSAIDLTRACCASDDYLSWLAQYEPVLHGSAGIANYLASAALAFEEQARSDAACNVDFFDARDELACMLMSSVPLDANGLRQITALAMEEARVDLSEPLWQEAEKR